MITRPPPWIFPLTEKPVFCHVLTQVSTSNLAGFPHHKAWSHVCHQHWWCCLSSNFVFLSAFLSVSPSHLGYLSSGFCGGPNHAHPPCSLIPASEQCWACSGPLVHFPLLATKSISTDKVHGQPCNKTVRDSDKTSARIIQFGEHASLLPVSSFHFQPGSPVIDSRWLPIVPRHALSFKLSGRLLVVPSEKQLRKSLEVARNPKACFQ